MTSTRTRGGSAGGRRPPQNRCPGGIGCHSKARGVIIPRQSGAGDAYDNALAESVIGLYKAEVIYRRGPWRGFDDVEYATLEWVAWLNTQRLLEPLGYVPPAGFEANYYRDWAAAAVLVALN